MKKKVLILFPEGNLPYSPTTLNLIEHFSKVFDTYVVASVGSAEKNNDPATFTFIKLPERFPIDFLNLSSKFLHKALRRMFPDFNKSQKIIAKTPKEKAIYKTIKKSICEIEPDEIIAIDLFALHCCQELKVKCNFLSLEIPSESIYLKSLSYSNIKNVFIQSEIRYSHLFQNISHKPPYFILPNSAVFSPPQKRSKPSKNLVYTGYIWSAFGPQFCLSFISKFNDFNLTLKGYRSNENLVEIFFPYLLQSGNVKVDEKYLEKDALSDFLLDYSIGFCFYNFAHPFVKMNLFNYETAPAGKLFSYLSVGIPVICSKITGFAEIEEMQCGILIENYCPDTIKSAIDKILDNYEYYSDNALEYAKKYDFKKHILPIIDQLLNAN